MISKELLALYDKCMEHNVSIKIEYMLSDACIEVTGKSIAYKGCAIGYIPITITKLVSIAEMNAVKDGVNLISVAIDEIFHEVLLKKEEKY